jgi:hypothetical protein
MSTKAVAITVLGSPEEIERLWGQPEYRDVRSEDIDDSAVTFTKAPGDRGTEIRVSHDERAAAMDGLRRFKQLVETGEITRSDSAPEGELAERKLKRHDAQPLDDSELEKAGLS